jgi:hypothetical protein
MVPLLMHVCYIFTAVDSFPFFPFFLIMKLSYTLPNEQPRVTAMEISEIVSAEIMLGELIAWLPSSTLSSFLCDFAQHLEAGDFNDILP